MEFDKTRLNLICYRVNDPTIRMKFVSIMITEYDTAMDKISSYIQENRLNDARMVCHKLIGEFKNMGVEFNPQIKAKDMNMSDVISFLDLITQRRSAIANELIECVTHHNVS